jgi:hypothetical protein
MRWADWWSLSDRDLSLRVPATIHCRAAASCLLRVVVDVKMQAVAALNAGAELVQSWMGWKSWTRLVHDEEGL